MCVSGGDDERGTIVCMADMHTLNGSTIITLSCMIYEELVCIYGDALG